LKKIITHLINKIGSEKVFTFYFRNINRSNTGMVITLHHVTQAASGGLNDFIEIRKNKLEEVIVALKKLNVKFVSLSDLENLRKISADRRPIVHLSFDDGYEDNYSLAFPVLKKHGVHFSIFLVSDFMNDRQPFLWWYMIEYIISKKIPVSFQKFGFEITPGQYSTESKEKLFEGFRNLMIEHLDANREFFKEKLLGYMGAGLQSLPGIMSWAQVNEMIGSGLCEVGVHTKSHARFSKLTDAEKITEITMCKDEILKHTGVDTGYFAYPYGSSEDIGPVDSLAQVMRSSGMRLAFTTLPHELNEASDQYLMPRVFINNSTTVYTLKTRLNGSYQRNFSSLATFS
jgi:peptidoglycan/xylan/chitin deacetylase (PgdA/CDA1 family)